MPEEKVNYWSNLFFENNEIQLEQMYRNCYTRTKIYILQNSGTEPQAKDIYQEAFIVLWKNVLNRKFVPESEGAIAAYLFSVSKHKWLDYLRSNQHKRLKRLDKVIENTEMQETVSLETNDTQLAQAMKVLDQLGEECREILEQFYFYKHSMRKISAHFNITEQSARNKKYRCMEMLRKQLKGL